MSATHKGPTEASNYTERAQKRVDDQALVVKNLKEEGKDSQSAERLLATYRQLLRAVTSR